MVVIFRVHLAFVAARLADRYARLKLRFEEGLV